jgi:hypothetical protein
LVITLHNLICKAPVLARGSQTARISGTKSPAELYPRAKGITAVTWSTFRGTLTPCFYWLSAADRNKVHWLPLFSMNIALILLNEGERIIEELRHVVVRVPDVRPHAVRRMVHCLLFIIYISFITLQGALFDELSGRRKYFRAIFIGCLDLLCLSPVHPALFPIFFIFFNNNFCLLIRLVENPVELFEHFMSSEVQFDQPTFI